MEVITVYRDDIFTPRMEEVLHLVARPCNRSQICEILGIKEKTLDSHLVRIMDRTGIHDYVRLIAYAQKNGYGKKQEVNT